MTPTALSTSSTYFNSRPREGANNDGWANIDSFSISIHAPARGQTGKHLGTWEPKDISIHAPARGQTAGAEGQLNQPFVFQFTPPRGGKPAPRSLRCLTIISIHAPARGQTSGYY